MHKPLGAECHRAATAHCRFPNLRNGREIVIEQSSDLIMTFYFRFGFVNSWGVSNIDNGY